MYNVKQVNRVLRRDVQCETCEQRVLRRDVQCETSEQVLRRDVRCQGIQTRTVHVRAVYRPAPALHSAHSTPTVLGADSELGLTTVSPSLQSDLRILGSDSDLGLTMISLRHHSEDTTFNDCLTDHFC